jgi:hypothetical protein
MNYTAYNPATGQIIYNINLSHESLINLNLAGHTYIEGQYSSDQYYIEDGQPVTLPDRPATNHQYQFDWTSKSWIIDTDHSSVVYRQQRNDLLVQIDRVNPVWYSSLTADQQAELVAYRQHLLDVPQQAGFPTDVEWPAKPAWL